MENVRKSRKRVREAGEAVSQAHETHGNDTVRGRERDENKSDQNEVRCSNLKIGFVLNLRLLAAATYCRCDVWLQEQQESVLPK